MWRGQLGGEGRRQRWDRGVPGRPDCDTDEMLDHGTEFFVGLESQVWDALARGDADADRELLSADFVGVYPTGFAGRDDHSSELSDGPSVSTYDLSDARVIEISDDAAMLCYRADYRRPGADRGEAMFVSSLWVQRDGRWWNTFSQDTPVGPPTV